MIEVAPLGYYWNGNTDAYDGAVHRLHLFVAASDQCCFAYAYEFRSHRGYTIALHEGTIQAARDGAFVVAVTYRYESNWDDYVADYRTEIIDTVSQRRVIQIKALDADKQPILCYNHADVAFKCTDSLVDAAYFARIRANHVR